METNKSIILCEKQREGYNKDSKGIKKLLEGWTEQTAITLVYVYVCLVCVCMCLCMCMCVFVFAMEIAKACDGNRSLRIEIATRDENRDVIAMEIAGCDTNQQQQQQQQQQTTAATTTTRTTTTTTTATATVP